MYELPRYVYLVGGIGEADYELLAFDLALVEAGIGDFNLSKLSSVFPVGASLEFVQEKGQPAPNFYPTHAAGTIMPTVYSTAHTTEPGVYASACVGVGVPHDKGKPGMIYEYHGNLRAKEASQIVTAMIEQGMAARGDIAHDVHIVVREVTIGPHYPSVASVVAAAVMLTHHHLAKRGL